MTDSANVYPVVADQAVPKPQRPGPAHALNDCASGHAVSILSFKKVIAQFAIRPRRIPASDLTYWAEDASVNISLAPTSPPVGASQPDLSPLRSGFFFYQGFGLAPVLWSAGKDVNRSNHRADPLLL